MRITKLWKGYECDHSSTNYSFYSSSRELTKQDREAINKFSSRAKASKHFVEFVYYGDFADLPYGAQDELLTSYFDVMIKESYDWWELILVLPYNLSLFKKLKECECEGEEDLGITISKKESQIHLSIFCVLDYEEIYNLALKDIELSNKKYWSPHLETYNPSPFPILGNLLIQLKIEIIKGDFTTLQYIAAFFNSEAFDKPTRYSDLGEWFTSALGHL